MKDQVRILKAEKVMGNKVTLRNVNYKDAGFIVTTRIDNKKSRFISKTLSDISLQENWLKAYDKSEDQAYFIITDVDNRALGTVRLYDPQGNSFCWGSWILVDEAPKNFAIESALIVYSYALKLGFTESHFDVRKGNTSVIKFHERFGAKIINETDEDFIFKISESAINESLNKYQKFLPNKIKIIK